MEIFQKIQKLKLYPKSTKTEVIKNGDHYHQLWKKCSSLLSNLRGGPRASGAGKNSKTVGKIANILKNFLNS